MKINKKGFTLIELLVVVLIIGILAAVALPQYRKAVGHAELAQVISATKAIQNAQERYYLVQGVYALSLQNLDIDLDNNIVQCISGLDFSICFNSHYLITHYYSQTANASNTVGCYGKNKQLVAACEMWLGQTAKLNGLETNCKRIGAEYPCWRVSGPVLPM